MFFADVQKYQTEAAEQHGERGEEEGAGEREGSQKQGATAGHPFLHEFVTQSVSAMFTSLFSCLFTAGEEEVADIARKLHSRLKTLEEEKYDLNIQINKQQYEVRFNFVLILMSPGLGSLLNLEDLTISLIRVTYKIIEAPRQLSRFLDCSYQETY